VITADSTGERAIPPMSEAHDGTSTHDHDHEHVALVVTRHASPSTESLSLAHSTTGTSALGLAIAWVLLVVTAGIGIVITRYFELVGVSNFGYAAVDQCLLPFTTLPVLAVAVHSPWLSSLLGEPIEQGPLGVHILL